MNPKKTQKIGPPKKTSVEVTQVEQSLWEQIISSTFEIGGEDQLKRIKSEYSEEPTDDEEKTSLRLMCHSCLVPEHQNTLEACFSVQYQL